jgi:DNA polymerase elongation subunit (family B)
MSDLLLGASPDALYYQHKPPTPLRDLHHPYFLAFAPDGHTDKARTTLHKAWTAQRDTHPKLSKITDIGPIETYRSFSDFTKKRDVFRVYTQESYLVPEISDYLFFDQHLATAEHDIPYQQRALADLAAQGKAWVFDTQRQTKTLRVMVYDIETTQYQEGRNDIPIDIIGYARFDLNINSEQHLDTEDFHFNIPTPPPHWNDIPITQTMATNIDQEITHLAAFCKQLQTCDILSGHNILSFDNVHLHGRITWILQHAADQLSPQEKDAFTAFTTTNCRPDKSFHFGVMRDNLIQIYPSCFDTYVAARKFYFFLDDYRLKALAPFLGINIPNRIYLTPAEIKLDDRTLAYNRHDIQEQLGVTINLLEQSLPLAFTTGLPFDMVLPAGAVHMWDHMALLRSAYLKKIMPPICRVKSIAQTLVHHFPKCQTKQDIVTEARRQRDQLSKDFIRVIKYSDEMPDWVQYPSVIYKEQSSDDDDEVVNYHMPGGMTLKPDTEAKSHFIPWYEVVVADVGAMYPTILKAMNIGADTVKLAKKNETPDAWVWMKKIPQTFLDTVDVRWRPIGPEDPYADTGVMIGVRIDSTPGVVNRSMTGIMSIIKAIKQELKTSQAKGKTTDLSRLQMMYQSMKGARNAGTHGILAAPLVSGRQFNLWGAAAITTRGQMILADTLATLNAQHIRVVYGDTDGIYLGCSKSAANVPNLAKALEITTPPDKKKWITDPEVAFKAIKDCNVKWQALLQYPEFELEAETHDAMIFVKHKNYLIFDVFKDQLEMVTKGNNFKGSDKANIARIALEDIMCRVLRENPEWEDEETARMAVKNSIKTATKDVVASLDFTNVDINDLTLIQSVQPERQYKPTKNGSSSVFSVRSEALEKLLGQRIRGRMKLRFVVTKKPLPGIPKPSKSGVKPIDYMYPVDLIKDRQEIDLEWYKKMVENYIQGAFGLSNLAGTEQTGLDSWM